MKLKRFHGCCSATPSSCSSLSASTASSPGTASSRCCRRQRVGNVVGQFVGNFKRPTDCNKICHNVVHDSGANAPNVASVNVAATTTTKLTTKSHNNSDRQQRDEMRRRHYCVVIFSSSSGQTFWLLHVAPKIYLLVGLQLHYICTGREGERWSRIGSCAKCRVALSFWLLWLAEDRQWMPKRMNLAAHFGDPKQHLQLSAIM